MWRQNPIHNKYTASDQALRDYVEAKKNFQDARDQAKRYFEQACTAWAEYERLLKAEEEKKIVA